MGSGGTNEENKMREERYEWLCVHGTSTNSLRFHSSQPPEGHTVQRRQSSEKRCFRLAFYFFNLLSIPFNYIKAIDLPSNTYIVQYML